MDKESVERLRYDRRLQRRTGWVEESAMESHIEALPDVSEKMTTGAALEDAEDEPVAAAAPFPSPSSAPSSAPSAELGGSAQGESVPRPVGGGFGGDSGSGAY
jgi:hypothetical protein